MKIKQTPESFIVEEVNHDVINDGAFFVYLLTKSNRNTQDIISFLQKKYDTKISYSGIKDKLALTKQFISTNKQLPELNEDSFSIKLVGKRKTPLSLGSHEGNKFIIAVNKTPRISAQNIAFPNYFGEQRFSKKNVAIATALLNRDWKLATELLDSPSANTHLLTNPNDYIGAIKLVHKKILRLILSSYQSYHFNSELSNMLATNEGRHLNIGEQECFFPENISFSKKTLSLIGWQNGDSRFLFKQIPEISLEGEERDCFCVATNFSYKNGIVSFFLPKGSYATVFLRFVFQENLEF